MRAEDIRVGMQFYHKEIHKWKIVITNVINKKCILTTGSYTTPYEQSYDDETICTNWFPCKENLFDKLYLRLKDGKTN